MTKPNIDRKIVDAQNSVVDAQNSVVFKGHSDALPITHRSQQHARLPVCHNSSSFATPHVTTPHDSTTHDLTPHDSSFAHYGPPRPVNTQHARLQHDTNARYDYSHTCFDNKQGSSHTEGNDVNPYLYVILHYYCTT